MQRLRSLIGRMIMSSFIWTLVVSVAVLVDGADNAGESRLSCSDELSGHDIWLDLSWTSP